MLLLSCYSSLAQQNLLVTKLRFHSYSKENGFQKLLQKLLHDPIVRSKVMTLFSRYFGLAQQDLLVTKL